MNTPYEFQLPTELPKTNQEAFDTVVRRLYDGRGRAFDGFRCQYRIYNDFGVLVNACAVGCLIPADKLPKDATTWSTDAHKKVFGNKSNVSCELLQVLQSEHDYSYQWNGNRLSAKGKQRLVDHAARFGLSTEVLDQVTNNT